MKAHKKEQRDVVANLFVVSVAIFLTGIFLASIAPADTGGTARVAAHVVSVSPDMAANDQYSVTDSSGHTHGWIKNVVVEGKVMSREWYIENHNKLLIVDLVWVPRPEN